MEYVPLRQWNLLPCHQAKLPRHGKRLDVHRMLGSVPTEDQRWE